MIKSENINELATALVKAQATIGGVHKGSKAFGYNYANLEAVIAAVKEPLNANGLSFLQLIEDSGTPNTVQVTTLLLHSSGQYIGSTGSTEIPEMKGCNLAQRAGAAQSYLKRYQLQALTGLPTEDNDASSEGFSKQSQSIVHAGTVTAEIKPGATSVTINSTNNVAPPKLTDAQANATVKAPSFSRNKKTTSSNDLGI
jgi:hypothetical protein